MVRKKLSCRGHLPHPRAFLPPREQPRGMAQPPSYSTLYPDQGTSESEGRQFLAGEGVPEGLRDAFVASVADSGYRAWIVDNSGSMITADGKRLLKTGNHHRMVGCTRWQEACDSVLYAGRVAANLRCATEFRFINPVGGGRPQVLTVTSPQDFQALQAACDMAQPSGVTPLCQQVREVFSAVAQRRAALEGAGKTAVVTIITDGLPTDGDLAQCIASFGALPILLVVRLCTKDDSLVEFWNNVDKQTEVVIDVLDDQEGEADEIAGAGNGWLSYGPPLHRAREWGVRNRLLDLIDERRFSAVEAMDFARLVLGGGPLPHPDVDMEQFLSEVDRRSRAAGPTFNPRRGGGSEAWIHVGKLRRAVGGGMCVVA